MAKSTKKFDHEIKRGEGDRLPPLTKEERLRLFPNNPPPGMKELMMRKNKKQFNDTEETE